MEKSTHQRKQKRGESRPIQPTVTRGQLLAMEARSASATKRSSSKPAPKLLSPAAPQPDTLREFVKSRNRTPIYRHPFVGCKVLNIQLAGTDISWTGTVYLPMVTIAQGDGDNERTGDVIRVIGVDVKTRVHIGSAAAPAADEEFQVQLCFTPLAALPISSVYEEVGTVTAGDSMDDWDFRAVTKRYGRYYGYVDAYHPSRTIEFSVRCNEMTNYDQGTATVSTGQWGLACISGTNTAGEMPAIRGEMQIYYQDV